MRFFAVRLRFAPPSPKKARAPIPRPHTHMCGSGFVSPYKVRQCASADTSAKPVKATLRRFAALTASACLCRAVNKRLRVSVPLTTIYRVKCWINLYIVVGARDCQHTPPPLAILRGERALGCVLSRKCQHSSTCACSACLFSGAACASAQKPTKTAPRFT